MNVGIAFGPSNIMLQNFLSCREQYSTSSMVERPNTITD